MTIFDEATAVRRTGDGHYEVRADERFALVPPGGQTPPTGQWRRADGHCPALRARLVAASAPGGD
ncbi:MAG TPA: hypothetical protein VK162_26570 [Streptosporangiaceae bacterium]|nr:hypothetical protein [Streptosporangiaceae bacterium]